ncbi:hypothetical protein [Marinobacter sp. HL-58]|uniref:hypothetical protein n=1 Tax=Marinobacter sp. HL-58 TaxID=1479237 RepID=UPI000484958D|nr:hypothetical protein [Marinobacter sp. HL-58]KPP97671.1 MAG: hypothetical protein HLUCCO03_10870 [Marinobacter sp. HL-58]
MFKIGLAAVALILSFGVQAGDHIEVVFSDLRFNIPAGFTVVGDIGDSQNMLVFRYGDEPGKQFLAFSDMTDDQTVNYGCPVGTFFEAVFFETNAAECDQALIQAMQENFVVGRDVATWSQDTYSLAYSDHGNKAFLFVIGEDSKLLKIDSDFLDGESLKRLADNI